MNAGAACMLYTSDGVSAMHTQCHSFLQVITIHTEAVTQELVSTSGDTSKSVRSLGLHDIKFRQAIHPSRYTQIGRSPLAIVKSHA